ncbi:unnamed protein product [Medioppia subpectinata]|uniref:Bromodomain-containing protein 8 n=1 Tax=Medioppia subpectinata TaxID=1979941 RepID=A0A7R9KBX8_9ACAR|nr:unnamed protein product [Medioppia subpectinata]CAG2100552.1 unnamed protein product [Medioppia subpectinata]
MSVNSPSNLKSRLRVVPIDEWSTREKLCLASSVLKSGDQNWSSVSRPLKSFCEPNRPSDWFHQKYCAIQYHDLLEKIETETPKRKRSERGEETPQTIIVRNLTKQRIEELRNKTQMEREMIMKVKHDLQALRDKQMSDKRIQELCLEIKDKELKDKEREVEHKKWLEERNVKISQMTRKGTFPTRPKPSALTTPATTATTASNTTVTETAAKSPLNEPLKVEVESDGNATQTVAQQPIVEKSAPVTPSPSTSPLLTSLLQSPTPSTPTLLSPTKSGLSVNPFARQKSPMTPVSRRPSIHLNEKTTESPLKISDKTESTVSNTNAVKPEVRTETSGQNDPKPAVESKLSKLLESPTLSKPKTTAISEAKAVEAKTPLISANKESKQTTEKSDQISTPLTTSDDKRVTTSKNKTKESKKEPEKGEEVHKKDESNERSLRSKDKTDESKADKVSTEKTEEKETDKSVDKKTEESVEKTPIKEEVMDTTSAEESQPKESDKPVVKEELTDATSSSAADESNQKTPLTRTNKRTRKSVTPLTITPTITRRSRRVALKDTKSTNDDSTEVSDQSAANTPQAVKKRGSVDDTTETSMSEESMDAKIPATASPNETVPNSPASVKTEDLKDNDSKEYKTWKKAVMSSTNESKLRARDRRSNAPAIPSPAVVPDNNEMSIRRKSRGASTDTDSNASSLTKSVTKKKKT